MDSAMRDPGIADGETTGYRGLIDGREVGAGTMTVAATDAAYRQSLAFTVERDAHYAAEIDFDRTRGTVVARHYRLETRHGDEPVAVEEGWFRDVRVLQFGGALRPYPRATLPVLGCALGLRGLDFERGHRRTFPLWLANTAHWEIDVRVERRERVTVPAGEFDAFKLRVRPSFEAVAKQLDRVIGLFLPPFTLHFATAEHAHRLLRFEFPTGPFPWNPRGLIEATSLAGLGADHV